MVRSHRREDKQTGHRMPRVQRLPATPEWLDVAFEYQYFLMFHECDRIARCTGFFFAVKQ